MIRTVTYDDSKFKIVPIKSTTQWELKFSDLEDIDNSDTIKNVIEAAPEYKEPENPLDMPLPCDIRIGAGTIKKGCKLSVLVRRMNVLYQMAMKTQLGIGEPVNQEPTAICKVCSGEMKPSMAMQNSIVTGSHDFHDQSIGVTMSRSGKAELVGCMKCVKCGHSFEPTKDE